MELGKNQDGKCIRYLEMKKARDKLSMGNQNAYVNFKTFLYF
jgi:hypothetical protein